MPAPTPDFSEVSRLLQAAIARHEIPGAVLVVGYRGHIAFEHAYGDRKLAGEPGLNGEPSPAEPMTEDTVFDMASLTKVIATTTAIGMLYDEGRVDFDAPVETYLPAFNPQHDPERARVTLRLLLTHFSGEPPDVDLKDPWGLAKPDKAEGLRRALTTPLAGTPGAKFVYSDINFILLGDIVETVTGWPLERYAQFEIFQPLGMEHTRYLPLSNACGAGKAVGAAMTWASNFTSSKSPDGSTQTTIRDYACAPESTWQPQWLIPNIAPTAHDDEGTAQTNPNYGNLLRGTVDDPTTRRMGGVAGHAGVFSTAHDMSLFAQALLDRLAGRPSDFPVKRRTLELMTTPEQPGHTPLQVGEAWRATESALLARNDPGTPAPPNPGVPATNPGNYPRPMSTDPLLDPNFPAIKDQVLRGFGWDIDSGYSKPRGRLPLGSFGHTGYTGTSLWLDPASDTYILLLTNAIHPHPGHAISNLRGEVATAAALGLRLQDLQPATRPTSSAPATLPAAARLAPPLLPANDRSPGSAPARPHWLQAAFHPTQAAPAASPSHTLTGIDVLEAENFDPLVAMVNAKGHPIEIALLTNQSGVDRNGHRTVDLLNNTALREKGVELSTLFSPEHGLFGQQDTTHLRAEIDSGTGLPVTSLYGPHDSDRRPSHDQLKGLDAVLIDLQDVGVRFYTYETVLGYFLEAAAREKTVYNHDLRILVLDRPDPLGGLAIQGPISDPGAESYTDFISLPIRHGLTLGELARYIVATNKLNVDLSVVAMQGWRRGEFYDDTGLPWINPSPNLRSLTATVLYPGLALLEMTNLSVGRGTATPFELFGAGLSTIPPTSIPTNPGSQANPGTPQTTSGSSQTNPGSPSSRPQIVRVGFNPNNLIPQTSLNTATPAQPAKATVWFHAADVAAALNARDIPGVRFQTTRTTIADDVNRYPFHSQTIEAVHVLLTDRNALDSPELGLEILAVLHRLYPTQFQLAKAGRLLANTGTLDALERGEDPRHIAANEQPALDRFAQSRQSALLYH